MEGLPTEEWARTQDEMKQRLEVSDRIDFDANTFENLRYVGGVDLSFMGEGSEIACAALVVLSFPSLDVVYQRHALVRLSLPYIPGFLAFREAPSLVSLIQELGQHHAQLLPQIIFVDGNGVLHPRGFGLASHLGVLVNVPTIGIGKNLLNVDGLDRKSVQEQCRVRLKVGGDWMNLKGESGRVWGATLRTTDKSSQPIYVSTGHRVCLETSISLTKRVSKFRIPEPIRVADLGSRDYIRKMKAKYPDTTAFNELGISPG